jgi:hypothetical protein
LLALRQETPVSPELLKVPIHRIASVLGRPPSAVAGAEAPRSTSPAVQALHAGSAALTQSTAQDSRASGAGRIVDIRRAAPVPRLTAIYVTEAALASADDADLLDGVAMLVRRLCMTSGYRLDEFPPAAAMAYAVDLYRRQVRDGGHASFAGAPQRAVLDYFTREGLAALGLDRHRAVFDEFLLAVGGDAQLSDADLEAMLADLDRAFEAFDADWPLVPRLAHWLREQPDLAVVSPEVLERTLSIIESLPPVLVRQRLEREALLAEAMTDASFRLGYSICAKAGRAFEGWVGHGPFAAPGQRVCEADFMATDAGPAAMLRRDTGLYELHDTTTRALLAKLSVMEPWASDPWLIDTAG